mmetsp:Transcript_8732/g.17031  ORF Transcript_8732/g.17031 Transcript_8732/m.17031 type:complete len:375 (+) Transcript_8732:1735-2859(+)
MGNCTCSTSKKAFVKSNFKVRLANYIECNKITKFRLQFAYCTGFAAADNAKALLQVDDCIFNQVGIELNSLTYAIRLGRLEIVKFLIDEAGASLLSVYKNLSAIKKTPMDLMCENGHFHLVQYLLPKLEALRPVLDNLPAQKDEDLSDSLFASTPHTQNQTAEQLMLLNNTYTAVQRACEKGHLPVVKFIYTYYKDSANVPRECNLHHIDETTGENCALLASKSGNLDLIKFLHKEVKVNFRILNRRRESALQLAIVGSKKLKLPFIAVVQYLCEEVGLDCTYEYEEALLLAEEQAIVIYIEKKLSKRGVKTNKTSIERKYSLKSNRPNSEDLIPLINSAFILEGISKELNQSDISSISVVGDICTPAEWSLVI